MFIFVMKYSPIWENPAILYHMDSETFVKQAVTVGAKPLRIFYMAAALWGRRHAI